MWLIKTGYCLLDDFWDDDLVVAVLGGHFGEDFGGVGFAGLIAFAPDVEDFVRVCHRLDAFDVVLVDPPRAGLDADTLDLVSRFEVVLYITCDPRKGLLENAVGPEAARALDGGEFEGELKGWTGLAKTHDLVRFAVFDHFPYTRHIECGACFVRRR